MRLISLKLKNYRQFKDAEIEFPDGVTGVVGLNGSGKSTLIEAISWTLYGNIAARTDKQGIKRAGAPPTSSVETTLQVEIGGIEYQISRMLKGQSQMGSGQVISGGKVIAESVKGMDKEIEYLLGMDFPSFKTSFLAKQKELNALSDLTPNQRKDVIIRMLRIDSIDKAIDLLRKETREKKQEAEIRKRSLKDENLLESQRQALANEIEKQKREVALVEDEIKKLEKDLSGFAEKFNEERKIYDEFNKKNNLKTEIEARLTGLKKREEELKDDLKEAEKLEKGLKSLKEQADEYKKLQDKINKEDAARQSRKDQIENRLNDLRKEYKEIEAKSKILKKGEPCPTCGQPIGNFEKINEHFKEEKAKITLEAERLKKEKEIIEKGKSAKETSSTAVAIEMKFDPVQYQKDLKRLEQLADAADKYPLALAKVEKKKTVETSLDKLTAEISSFKDKLSSITKEINDVPYDSKKHEKITEEFNALKKVLDSKYHVRNEGRVELGNVEGELKAKEKEIRENAEASKIVREMAKSQEERKRLEELMTEYRDHLISRIQPELAEISGRLFTELTNGKYQGVELDENYEMHIYDGGVKYPLSRFSGGEADLANLCLRLAISQLISASTGAETGFIILDEIFGSQDQIRKNAIMEALSGLSKMFRQIILITHVDEIKDGLENLIEVTEDDSGMSSVKQ